MKCQGCQVDKPVTYFSIRESTQEYYSKCESCRKSQKAVNDKRKNKIWIGKKESYYNGESYSKYLRDGIK